MRVIQLPTFRALCSLIIGILLVRDPGGAVKGITVAIGAMFLISGAMSCIAYFIDRRQSENTMVTDTEGHILTGGRRPSFPLVGIGSLILGLLLAITPGVFVTGLMYIIGIILVAGAVGQIFNLMTARKYGQISFVFWIAPSLILLTGLYVMIKPMQTAELPMIVLGWCSMLYGATEIINTLKIYTKRKQLEQKQNEH